MTLKLAPLLALLLLLVGVCAASAFSLGYEGRSFGKLGALPKNSTVVVPVGCASPTAPNGVVDFSQCSNAFYVAVIF